MNDIIHCYISYNKIKNWYKEVLLIKLFIDAPGRTIFGFNSKHMEHGKKVETGEPKAPLAT
jgi:hypothetical protein